MKSSEIVILVVVLAGVGVAVYLATRRPPPPPVTTRPQGPSLGQSIGGIIDAAAPVLGGLI